MENAVRTTPDAVSCAACGAVVELAAGICDGCHFLYCVGHADGDEHDCSVVCAECPDSFDAWFWSDGSKELH